MMHSLLGVLALAVFASGAAPKYASEYEPVSSSNVNGSVPVTITISFFPENESALENALPPTTFRCLDVSKQQIVKRSARVLWLSRSIFSSRPLGKVKRKARSAAAAEKEKKGAYTKETTPETVHATMHMP